jgi:2-oxoglutarate/2-oxoacid ferredoxin oxidoreductase subunit beta
MTKKISADDIVKEENLVYKKTPVLTNNVMHYCPGCGHGTAHRLIAEVIEEMDIQSETIGITPVGCSVLMYNYLDIDMQEAAHGRAPALATAIKRLMPAKFVFTYQGDGDLAAIGTAETIHACNRGKIFQFSLLIMVFTE